MAHCTPAKVTSVPAWLSTERPKAAKDTADPTLNEYNAYLAELAENDKQDRTTT